MANCSSSYEVCWICIQQTTPMSSSVMKAKTIRNIHSILSGVFATAKRWDWIDWEPGGIC